MDFIGEHMDRLRTYSKTDEQLPDQKNFQSHFGEKQMAS